MEEGHAQPLALCVLFLMQNNAKPYIVEQILTASP